MGKEPAASVTKKIEQFDVVNYHQDHSYVGNPPISTGSRVYKTIMREWKSLRQDLPESIYVRAYEGRIDLLRAVIVGASGTPYHNCLFFFDIAFPPDYPNVPPMAKYNSFGIRLNPNLYEDGTICLSLLNTWHGPRWEPYRSSILQVLVSLQALVLNEKPYFNEPLYDLLPATLLGKSSKKYNNYVFLMACKTLLHLHDKPPKNFEDFIGEHTRSHGRVILTACKAYAEGFATVGHYQDEASFLPERVPVQSWFKDYMNWLYPRLVAAFAKNDGSLQNFVSQLDVMIGKTTDMYIQKEKEKKNTKLSFFGILKKIFGFTHCGKSNAALSLSERSSQVNGRGRKRNKD